MPTSRRRLLTAAVLIASPVAALAPAAGAVAATPTFFVVHVDDTFVSRTSVDCGFEILLHVQGTYRAIDHLDKDDEVVRSLETYPNFTYTFINAETGVSVTSHSPDPGHYTWNADGSFTLQVTGLVMHLVVPGQGTVAGQAGRFAITVDAAGESTESEPVGLNEDYHSALCQILAP
jgi:hypothetical protein